MYKMLTVLVLGLISLLPACSDPPPPIVATSPGYIHVAEGNYICKEIERKESTRSKDPRVHVYITSRCVFLHDTYEAYHPQEKERELKRKHLLQTHLNN